MIAFEADFCASTKEKIGNYPLFYAMRGSVPRYAISVSNLCFLTSGEEYVFSVFFAQHLFLSPCQINIEAKACCTTYIA